MRHHIRQGRVIDPANQIDALADVCIADGRIIAVGAVPEGFVADNVLDVSGMLVLPGLVDLSARVSSSDEAFGAALAGGVTSLVQPPEMMRDSALTLSPQVNVYHLGALTVDLKGQALTEMVRLTQSGCVGFSQGNSPLQDTAILLRALQYAKSFDYAVWCRPQDPWLSSGGVVASGAYASRLGLAGIPVEAETVACHTLLCLQRASGVRMHLCRLSSAEAIGMVRKAKTEGQAITCDVVANQVHLTDIDIGFYDSHFRLDPPLRSQRDRDAIRKGLADGTIDALCSDHTPVDDDDKMMPFAEAQPGATGLELLLSLTLKWAQDAKVPLLDAIARVTRDPARIICASSAAVPPCGQLGVGVAADICIVDSQASWQVTRPSLLSQSQHTPFLNMELPGRVVMTIVRGHVAWEATT
jgi:dihydroorotase